MKGPAVDDARVLGIWDAAVNSAADFDADRSSGGEYRTPLWELCRLLKGEWLFMCSHDAGTHLQTWMLRNRRSFTEFAGIGDEDEGSLQFAETWERVRVPAGKDALGWAWEQAQKRTIPFEVGRCGESFLRFVNLCHYLQLARGRRTIILPLRKIGALLGVSKTMTSTYIGTAVRMGFLVLAVPHVFRASEKRAAEYFFGVAKPLPQGTQGTQGIQGVESSEKTSDSTALPVF